jgi:hypothetical protein
MVHAAFGFFRGVFLDAERAQSTTSPKLSNRHGPVDLWTSSLQLSVFSRVSLGPRFYFFKEEYGPMDSQENPPPPADNQKKTAAAV